MVEVLFQSFSPIIGHMIKTDNFLYELSETFFVVLPMNWRTICKNVSSMAKLKKNYYS